MTEARPDLIDALHAWEAALERGDHARDAWAMAVLKADAARGGTPVFFEVPRSLAGVTVALDGGVDLSRRDAEGATVLHQVDLYDAPTYAWVADALAPRLAPEGGVDVPDADGLSPLSIQVKFGQRDHARALLERGASPFSVARIRRYGLTPLSVAEQAVGAMAWGSEDDPQSLSIDLLQMLKAHGLRLSSEARGALQARAADRPAVARWITENL